LRFRRRLRRFAHAGAEALRNPVQQRLRVQGRLPRLAEARRSDPHGNDAVKWLAHPWLTIRVQIALGIIFIAAALPKIVDPPSFARMIYNYNIMPWSLTTLTVL